MRLLEGHPLLAYSVQAAIDSGIFDAVVLSTDSAAYAKIGQHYGAEVPFLRPNALAQDASPDIEWVQHLLQQLSDQGRTYELFSILRPTSPFRTASTIRRAFEEFYADAESVDSLRAVEPCAQHPGKMWRVEKKRLVPLLPGEVRGAPWHSSPTQSLPSVWVQNASLEISWTRCAEKEGTIAGPRILPFFTRGEEGLDVNTERDWEWASFLLAQKRAHLPALKAPASHGEGLSMDLGTTGG